MKVRIIQHIIGGLYYGQAYVPSVDEYITVTIGCMTKWAAKEN